MTTAVEPVLKQAVENDDGRVAHLVLKPEWPVALCGFVVQDHLGTQAPGRDRCAKCLEVCRSRGLGKPAWLL